MKTWLDKLTGLLEQIFVAWFPEEAQVNSKRRFQVKRRAVALIPVSFPLGVLGAQSSSPASTGATFPFIHLSIHLVLTWKPTTCQTLQSTSLSWCPFGPNDL